MSRKILFLTDSLGLPRPDQTIKDDETWCQLVAKDMKQSDYEFFFQLHGGLHTKRLLLLRRQGYIGGYQPDIVVLQIGIVDCSSRVLGERAKEIISRIPFINRLVRNFIKKFHKRLSLIRDITYVDRKNFRTNLESLKNSFEGASFLVIPIAPPTKGFIDMMPLIERNIFDYNKILNDVFGRNFQEKIYDGENPESFLLDDHYHLNKKGHSKVAQFIQSKLV
ncbi:MAG: SGNH/GDSL hydrolase family protein [Bacteriovoracaceae bacterium]|nr:SGNH/GDSL hydrolase family protein [Bacteriovoracaceae bacterium]